MVLPTLARVGQGSAVKICNRYACLKKKQGSEVSLGARNVCYMENPEDGPKCSEMFYLKQTCYGCLLYWSPVSGRGKNLSI